MSLKTSLGQLQQPPIVCCPLFVDTYLVLALFLITISHHILYFSKLVPISQQVQQGHSLKDLAAPCFCAGHGTSGDIVARRAVADTGGYRWVGVGCCHGKLPCQDMLPT